MKAFAGNFSDDAIANDEGKLIIKNKQKINDGETFFTDGIIYPYLINHKISFSFAVSF